MNGWNAGEGTGSSAAFKKAQGDKKYMKIKRDLKRKTSEYEPQTETRKNINTDITPQTQLGKKFNKMEGVVMKGKQSAMPKKGKNDGTVISKDGKKIVKTRTLTKAQSAHQNIRNVLGFDKRKRDTQISNKDNVTYSTKDIKPSKHETPEQFKKRKKMISKHISKRQLKTLSGGGPTDVNKIKDFEKATEVGHAVQHMANKRKKK